MTAAWGSATRDFDLMVDGPGGRQRSRSIRENPLTMYREARAVFIESPAPGRYTIGLDPRAGSGGEITLGLIWDVPWPRPMSDVLDRVLDGQEPMLCTSGDSAYHLVLSSTPQTDRLTGRPC